MSLLRENIKFAKALERAREFIEPFAQNDDNTNARAVLAQIDAAFAGTAQEPIPFPRPKRT